MLQIKEVKTSQEIEQLFELLSVIWKEVFTPIIGKEQVAYMMRHYQSIDNITQEIEDDVHYYFLEYNSQPVGYTAFQDQGEKIYISKLYLSQSFRGKGLMSSVFDWYETLGKGKTLFLNVNQGNHLAIAVYEHRGFTKVGERYVDIGEGYIMNDFIYEKVIKG